MLKLVRLKHSKTHIFADVHKTVKMAGKIATTSNIDRATIRVRVLLVFF